MTLPQNDRELSMWLVKECLEDYQEIMQKRFEIQQRNQKYSPEKERQLDDEFGSLKTAEGRKRRLVIEQMITDGIHETSLDIMIKLQRFNPLIFAVDGSGWKGGAFG